MRDHLKPPPVRIDPPGALVLACGLLLIGASVAATLRLQWFGVGPVDNVSVLFDVSWYVALVHEIYVYPVAIGATAAVFALARRPWPEIPGRVGARLLGAPPVATSLVVLIALIAAAEPIYHGTRPGLDEFLTEFQADIFRDGAIYGQVPPEWTPFMRALQSQFVFIDAERGLWSSYYRPVFALLYLAARELAGGVWLNPVLTAASGLLVASIARRLWPARADVPPLAALLLLSSPQTLAAGLGLYSMPAHMFFNLAWLRLILIRRPLAHGLALVIGFLAIGLHQIHNHLLFAAPFIVLVLWRAQRIWAVVYAATYLASLIFWLTWTDALAVAIGVSPASVQVAHSGGFVAAVFSSLSAPGLDSVIKVVVHLARFALWQNLALVPLVFLGLRALRHDRVLMSCAVAVALTVMVHLLLVPTQGHGWGYRYLHPVLGPVVLVALAGWVGEMGATSAGASSSAMGRALAGWTIATLVLLLPLHATFIERYTRTIADATAYLRQLPYEVVLIDLASVWYGGDLGRNDPFLRNTPKMMVLLDIRREDLEALCHSRRAAVVDHDAVGRFGILRVDPGSVAALPGASRFLTDIPPACPRVARP